MKKFAFIVFIIAVCLIAAACRTDNQIPPAMQEPPAEAVQAELPAPPEQHFELFRNPPPPPPGSSLIEPPNTPEPAPTPTPVIELSARAQYILNAGQFNGKTIDPCGFTYYTTYTNTALGLVYCNYDRNPDCDFLGIVLPIVDVPGGMMGLNCLAELFVMRVIDGCGAEWVIERAETHRENLLQMWREHEEFLRELLGDEELEKRVPQWAQSRAESVEYIKYYEGDYFEISFCFPDFFLTPEEIAFWPAEYKAAGRIFRGFQINVVQPASGFSDGITHLYTQIDDDVAVVIFISSRDWAGYATRRHMARIAELPPATQLSAQAQYILDAGQFSADFVDELFIAEHSLFSYGRYTTYTNKALELVYHYDAEAVDDRRFAGVGRPWVDPPGGMMWAIDFGMSFDMLVIDGCGAQWAREQADYHMEGFIQRWQEWEEYKRERYGEEFEAQIPRWVQSVNENNERLKYYLGDDFEKDFCYIDFLVNPENIAFWPIQYEAAGITFTGLQINAIMPGAGFIIGVTHLYVQIDDDVAVVITISVSEDWAGSAARRHMSRITAIPT